MDDMFIVNSGAQSAKKFLASNRCLSLGRRRAESRVTTPVNLVASVPISETPPALFSRSSFGQCATALADGGEPIL
ncbi:MAG: hypothetical protein OXQ29_04920 [Rhodospirillaceae bacterium]|nr:hypothetical protein [Rhodospirillaceae bacterium]